jgi:hypothetical protein
MNAIRDNPVTTEDIELAERILGPDVGSLKGKATRQKPMPVVNDFVDIHLELYETHKAVQLSIDTLFVNKILFLTSVSRNIQFRTAKYLPNTTLASYRSGIESLVRMYKTAGFTVTATFFSRFVMSSRSSEIYSSRVGGKGTCVLADAHACLLCDHFFLRTLVSIRSAPAIS